MKKLFAFIMLAGVMTFGLSNNSIAQTDTVGATTTDTTAAAAAPAVEETAAAEEEVIAVEEKTFHQVMKEKFIEGDVVWMTPVLLCLIIGLALCIERVITLNLSTTNSKKLLAKVEEALANGNIEAAKEITRNTRGPVASIFTQGLMRVEEGIDIVEKSIVSYGSVEMGRLEKGLIWISLFIALAPMLGFLGTVVGMIQAFDAIEAAGDISPTLVAGGIKVALLTTVFGLVVAIILQVLYNYSVSKIDGIVNDMEDASISFVDLLIKFKISK